MEIDVRNKQGVEWKIVGNLSVLRTIITFPREDRRS